jgi:hypothetical protein
VASVIGVSEMPGRTFSPFRRGNISAPRALIEYGAYVLVMKIYEVRRLLRTRAA